jgi:hypothetical protein
MTHAGLSLAILPFTTSLLHLGHSTRHPAAALRLPAGNGWSSRFLQFMQHSAAPILKQTSHLAAW